MLLILFLAFTLIPALEIYLLVQVGDRIGAFQTVALVILTGIFGAALARSQGRALLQDAQRTLARGELPSGAVLQGFLVLAGGILLLTPGFFTDALGLLCVIPGSRHLIAALLQRFLAHQILRGRIHVFTSARGSGFPPFRHDGAARTTTMRDVSPRTSENVIEVNSQRLENSTDDEK